MKTRRASWLPLLGASALGAFLFAITAAFAPGLHEHLHAEAGQAQHECALTIVGAGSYAGADTGPAFVPPITTADRPLAVSFHPAWVPTIFSRARVFEHAPPRFLSA